MEFLSITNTESTSATAMPRVRNLCQSLAGHTCTAHPLEISGIFPNLGQIAL